MKKINIKNIKKLLKYDQLSELSSRVFDNNEITVSILCLCYNHAPYIGRCLDMFLKQRVNFNVEVLVHDDASNDGSVDILKKYEQKYPQIIKVIYEKENQYSKGINIENTILSKYIRGKYVAICEGDDYWSDPFKLAIQVECFTLFPNISFSTHKVTKQNLNGDNIGYIPQKLKSSYIFKRSEIVPRIIKSYIFHTTSYMFKSSDYLKYCYDVPEFAKHLKVGDYGLQLYFSNLGETAFLDMVMSTHVDNVPGSWTQKSRNATLEQANDERKNIIESLELFDRFTNCEFHNAFQKRFDKTKMHELYSNGDYIKILENRKYRRELYKYDKRSLFAIFLMIKHPKIYQRIKKWRQASNK